MGVVRDITVSLRALLLPRVVIAAEDLALRHQIGVLQRSVVRPRLRQREALGQSVVDMLLAGVSTRRVGELLERIIDLPVSAGQVSTLASGWTARSAVPDRDHSSCRPHRRGLALW